MYGIVNNYFYSKSSLGRVVACLDYNEQRIMCQLKINVMRVQNDCSSCYYILLLSTVGRKLSTATDCVVSYVSTKNFGWDLQD
jgi:hypothetical protein